MDDDRLRCAEAAMATVPADYRTIGAAEVVAEPSGHHFHRGLHFGWVWGQDDTRGCFLDFLSEHRMAGMRADRWFPDGRSEPITTPAEFRMVSHDPVEDAKLERSYVARNRAAYDDLRRRGLLPPFGENIGSQDINEYLRTSDGADEAPDT